MKPILLLLIPFLLGSCTLAPRTNKGRTLSPDREVMAPDHVPAGSASPDSLQ